MKIDLFQNKSLSQQKILLQKPITLKANWHIVYQLKMTQRSLLESNFPGGIMKKYGLLLIHYYLSDAYHPEVFCPPSLRGKLPLPKESMEETPDYVNQLLEDGWIPLGFQGSDKEIKYSTSEGFQTTSFRVCDAYRMVFRYEFPETLIEKIRALFGRR
jgi:hypothetical protein